MSPDHHINVKNANHNLWQYLFDCSKCFGSWLVLNVEETQDYEKPASFG